MNFLGASELLQERPYSILGMSGSKILDSGAGFSYITH